MQVNQIEHWQQAGVLTKVDGEMPNSVRWTRSGAATLNERARAYLDINCAHCHNSDGAADTSGLHLNIEAPVESILIFRMDHTDPAIAMPELGRSTVHTEGVQLITEWIASLEGDC